MYIDSCSFDEFDPDFFLSSWLWPFKGSGSVLDHMDPDFKGKTYLFPFGLYIDPLAMNHLSLKIFFFR